MKKLFALLGLVITLVSCSTPQPGTTPDNTNTTNTISADTTRTDTTQLKLK